MKLDLLEALWQMAKTLSYMWAVVKPDTFRTQLFVRNTDYPEEGRFIPDGKVVRVTLEFINEEEAE